MERYTALNINTLTDTNQNKLIKYLANNPITLDQKLFPSTGHTVKLGELIDSAADEPFKQRTIEPSNVSTILVGNELGFIKTGRFVKPITLGYLDETSFSIVGGRNRLVALLTLLVMSGYNTDSDEVRDIDIPVFKTEFSQEIIMADNKSRRITGNEKNFIDSQIKGVDPEDLDSIIDGFKNGLLNEGSFMALASQLARQDIIADESRGINSIAADANLIIDSVMFDVIKSYLTQLKGKQTSEIKKLFKNHDYVLRILTWFIGEKAPHFTPLAKAVKAAKVTNFARDYKSVAAALVELTPKNVQVPPKVAPKMTKKQQAKLAELTSEDSAMDEGAA